MHSLQTIAKEQAASMKALGESGCLAFCYAYTADALLKRKTNEAEMIMRLCQARGDGVIDAQCNVYDANYLLRYYGGRKFDVKKTSIADGDISHIIKPTPVRFLAKGHGGHWVVVENGQIVWNPLIWSFNVEHGKAIEAREVALLEV